MVNNSWKTVTLSQIGTFQKGSGISRAESNSGVLPAVRYGELYTVHNNYVRTYTSHISREVANKALRVHYGDVLFACSGETKEDIAKCAAIIDNSEVYAGGDIIVLSPTTEVDPIFLGFILNTPNVIQQRAQKAQGDAIVHISADSIKSIEITVPEYAEQVKIAEALSDIDTLIVNLEKLIAKKKAIKQGAMQELLTGKRRLPGFDSEWKTVQIGTFTSVFSGGTPSTANPLYWGGNIPWMSSGELNMKIVREVRGRITATGMENSSTRMIPAFCVLIGLAGQGKTRGTAAFNTFPLCTNQSIAAIFPNESQFDSKFLYFYMDTQYTELRELSAGGGGRGGLTKKLIEDFYVTIPSDIKEQVSIAEILTDIDDEIENLEKELYKTTAIKQGMMSELLTGHIRLIDKEDA